MGLRFDPVGGGQFKQAVKAIIDAESQPIKQLEGKKQKEEARLKNFQEFKGKFTGLDKALTEFADFRKFRELKVDLGDGANLMSVTVDKDKAEPGSYQFEVNDLAQRTSVMTNGFDDPEKLALGTGFVVMKLRNGDTAEIYVDQEHSSLRGVANLINNQTDSLIRASVIKDASSPDNPWKLVMTGKKEGDSNQLEFPDLYFMDSPEDFYIDGTHDAKNATLTFNGFPVQLDGNDITDFLPGVNMHLKQAKPDSPFTLSITEDHQKVAGKVKGLVDQLNGVLGFIMKQNQVDDKTDTRTMLTGDSGLQTVEFRIRNLLHEGFPVGIPGTDENRYVHLNDIGVEFDKTGTITFKEEKFTKALESDFDGVSEAVTGEFGFARQLRDLIGSYTQSGSGMLATRESGFRSRIKEIDRQIDDKTARLEKRQQALTDRFARLEATISNLQRQQQYVAQTLGGSAGSSIAQLLG